MADLASIVKAYDIRGVVPDSLDEGVAEAVGAEAAGADVLAGGLGSTDMLYYASGNRGVPGAMITASHNPAQYNGIKLCRAGAKPVGTESGPKDIKDLAERPLDPAPKPGTVTRIDLLSGDANHLRKLVDITGIRPLKVVVDAGHGMAGHTAPKVFEGLTLIPLCFELDGTFPNHEANPLDPANLRDLQRAVLDQRADLGLAFDGDADRCFVVDERGAVSGGEHSGHFYFSDFWFADSGLLAALHVLAALGSEAGISLSQLLAGYCRYVATGEINSEVADAAAATALVKEAFADRPGISTDELDGLTVSAPTWWFNLRPSNTEPLLRLNAEADTQATMVAIRDEVLGLVRGTTDRSGKNDS